MDNRIDDTTNIKKIDARKLYSCIAELVQEGETVSVQITGNSMAPFLYHMRDTLFFTAVDSQIKVGDICLFRRDDGQYVVHRVCRIDDGIYSFIGDGQTQVEEGIRLDQILARVYQVRRKGKIIDKRSFWWFFFRHIWIHMIKIRRPLMEAYARIHPSRKAKCH